MKDSTRESIVSNLKMVLCTVNDCDLLESDDIKFYKKIRKRLKEGADLTPEDLEEIVSLGYTLTDQSFYDETMACCESVLMIDPSNYEAHREIADFNHENGDMGSAIKAYDKVLEIYTTDGEAYKLSAHNHYFNSEWMVEHFKEKQTLALQEEAIRHVIADYEKWVLKWII